MPELTWLDKYLQYLIIERHYSSKTKIAYAQDIHEFINFMNTNNNFHHFKDVCFADIEAYLTYLDEKQLARSSVARKISSLRAFYTFLVKNEYLKDNPFINVELKKKPKRLPEFFYEKEMETLIKAASGDSPLAQRNQALIEVLYATGIRVSECVSLTIKQIDFDLKVMLIHGKGDKDRYVSFGQYALRALQRYLNDGRLKLLKKQNHDVVFVNHLGKPLTSAGIEYILRQIIKKTNLTADIHPHMLRHTFATQMLNHDADLRTVQALLGHSSLSTTQIYTHVTMAHLQKDYRNHFPRAK